MLALLTILVLLVASSSPLGAQIYEWRDASGSRNFTNDIEDIPEAQREEAKVIVRARRAPAPEVQVAESSVADVVEAVAPEPSPRRVDRERRRAEFERWRADREQLRLERESSRGAQVVYDNSFRFARPEPAPPPQVNINISGPLAVSQVIVPEPQPYLVDPGYDVVYEPLVSTSFDRGRYRHRTVRMRLQDQFQYDRNGPSLIVGERIPLGPRFRAKLPRGVRSCSSTRSRSIVLRR